MYVCIVHTYIHSKRYNIILHGNIAKECQKYNVSIYKIDN